MQESTKKTLEENWKNATLANNFIFYKVMRHHPEACKYLIEMLLHIQIESMEMHNEEVIDLDHDAKGIRLDVYVKDLKRMFDIELQVIGSSEIPKRSRYYSALMCLDTLKSGDDYEKLRDGHVIFICLEDIFNDGLPFYSFENICTENLKTKLNDRDYKHFFIAPKCAKMIEDKESKAFFEFIISNKANSKYTSELHEYVEDAKHNQQWRHEYMTWETIKAEAYNNGVEQKAIEDALMLIHEYREKPEIAAQKMKAPLDKVLEALRNGGTNI